MTCFIGVNGVLNFDYTEGTFNRDKFLAALKSFVDHCDVEFGLSRHAFM